MKGAKFFNEYLRQSNVLEQWNNAIIILLHKKGEPKNININITSHGLLCFMCYVCAKVIPQQKYEATTNINIENMQDLENFTVLNYGPPSNSQPGY